MGTRAKRGGLSGSKDAQLNAGEYWNSHASQKPKSAEVSRLSRVPKASAETRICFRQMEEFPKDCCST
ncbi:hypothetical protein E4T56_gene9616 [Termitomyces sp. T112]|nr:hypothetical protein E4T56_gene9616 [Termitomyces sp. T112]